MTTPDAYPVLLDELARVFAMAALDAMLEEAQAERSGTNDESNNSKDDDHHASKENR